MRPFRINRVTVLAILAGSVFAATAFAATTGLPPGVQVNNDPPAIDPAQDAGLTDLTAGTVTAGNARVPWAAFSQKNADGSQQMGCGLPNDRRGWRDRSLRRPRTT
jgi:hypothetical protein